MTVSILIGDVRDRLREMPADSVDCVVTSPPYWGLRDYGVAGQIGLEPTLGEHLAVMVDVFEEVRRVLKPTGTLWLNYGDCYATSPNGRSAADTKAAGTDDRTFRDKPFSTIGAIQARSNAGEGQHHDRRGGILKPKDLCMVPNRLAIALQEAGWWVRSEIIWGKPNGMPDSSGKYRPSTSHEKIFLLSKTGKCSYDAEAVKQPCSPATNQRLAQNVAGQSGSDRANAGSRTNGRKKAVANRSLGAGPKSAAEGTNIKGKVSFHESTAGHVEARYLRNYEPAPVQVWHMPVQGFREAHFATFPPELAERCLLAGCPKGGTVLDPFGGAGTTALVADRMGLDCTIIELNPEYAEIARKRITGEQGMFANVTVANDQPAAVAA